jgi:phosphate:Na+ symporter
MTITTVLQMVGGVGLFLFGMNLLSSYLEKLAGPSMGHVLERLTNNPIKGVALGTCVTGIIQSSNATTLMVMGFVNAGMMTLYQAAPVIMGANIGTTVTAQILSLGDISDTNVFLSLLKPSSFAPVCVIIGAIMIFASKKKRTKQAAYVLMGLGILFIGMTTMESALAPLKDSETFKNAFFMFKNPVLGMLLGVVVTAIIQSSSVSVGMLQALSTTGAVTFSMAAPIVMGMNIGKCLPEFLACIGATKKAKKTIAIDLMINVIGTAVFFAVLYSVQKFIGFSFWDKIVDRSDIAMFHSFFNIITIAFLLPLYKQLIKLVDFLIKEKTDEKMEKLAVLDDIFINNPSVAIDQCRKAIIEMGKTVEENFELSNELLYKADVKKSAELEKNEKFLDRCETVLGDYLVKITAKSISDKDSHMVTEIIHTMGDFERIGDYCINISEVGEYNREQNIDFSDRGKHELNYVIDATRNVIRMTVQSYTDDDLALASKIEPLEETIDMLVDIVKEKHVERLKAGECDTQSGITFTELLSNIERISDHCSNIAVHIFQRINGLDTIDTHELLNEMHKGTSEKYTKQFSQYSKQYYDPIK